MAGAEGSIAPESGLFREQIGHIADRGTHHGAERRITCGFQHRRLRVIRQGKHRLQASGMSFEDRLPVWVGMGEIVFLQQSDVS